MKAKLKNLVWLAAVFGLLLPAADSVSSQVKNARILMPDVSKVQVNGICRVCIRPDDIILESYLRFRLNGKPLVKQRIKVNGSLVPEMNPGVYLKTFKGFKVLPGKMVKVTIDLSPGVHRLRRSMQKYNGLLAAATVKVPMRFVTPGPDARVRILPVRQIRIAWTPGTGEGPMSCTIFEFSGPNSPLPKPIYKSGDIFQSSVSLSTRIFKPKKKYGIYIYRKMDDFKFMFRLAPGSHLTLGHLVGTYIFTQ